MNTRRTRPQLEQLEARTVPAVSLVKDIALGGSDGPWSDDLVDVNGTVFFAAHDGGATGVELWKSDGTEAGTVLVKDIRPGGDPTGSSYPTRLTNVNGTLFFIADDGTHGYELWKSDGTASGTVLVKDINPGSAKSYARSFTNVNGTLFFTADDGVHGSELWKSDGTETGTVMVKDIFPGSYGSEVTGSGSYFANVNGTLFFIAADGVTANAFNGSNAGELWKSDGTEAGTVLVKDIEPGIGEAYPGNLINVNGMLLFTAGVPGSSHNIELWKSDGTEAGTVLVKDINPGGGTSVPRNLTNVAGTLFFSADDGTHGYELWKSDGTTAGTVLVADLTAGSSSFFPEWLTNVNGKLFFFNQHNGELWQSDGTTAGTVLVKDTYPGEFGSYFHYSANVNGTLFFAADDGVHGHELWQSDGTEAGTVLAADINPGSISSDPQYLVNANGTLVFTADDGVHGTELWIAGEPPPDTVNPVIASTAFTGSTAGTFDKITVTFNEPVQAATVNSTNITLTGPSGAISITNIAAVAGSNDTQFDVTFDPQNVLGDYTMNAAVGILDLAGNPLPQAFSVTRTLSASTGPRIVALGQSDGSVKILDGDTNEVLVASFRPLDTPTSQYKSTVAVALGDLDGDGTDELFVGAQKRAGVAGLDASKAGKVFVFNVSSVIDTGSTSPLDTITPFAKNFDGTQTYETGFELATGDVNGDGVLDLIASSRGDVGQISVMSGVGTGTGHARIGSIVTPFGVNYRGKVTVAAGNFIAETGTQNDEVAAARGNTDSTNAAVPGTSTRVAMFDLVGSALSPITFSGAISAQGIPGQMTGSSGQVIDRNAFVAPINLSGTGPDLLLFAARDFVSNAANPQIRVCVYGIDANGGATLQSSAANGDSGSYLVGNQVGSYAIARSDIDGNGADSLAMVVDGPSAGVLYLAPLTGGNLGGLTTPVLTGGVRIASN